MTSSALTVKLTTAQVAQSAALSCVIPACRAFTCSTTKNASIRSARSISATNVNHKGRVPATNALMDSSLAMVGIARARHAPTLTASSARSTAMKYVIVAFRTSNSTKWLISVRMRHVTTLITARLAKLRALRASAA